MERGWECAPRAYLNYERSRKQRTLSLLATELLGRVICYSNFGRAYDEYKRDLPASMKDISMASQSGCHDRLFGRSTYYTTSDGKRYKAEIFVAPMPYSNLPFGLATQN